MSETNRPSYVELQEKFEDAERRLHDALGELRSKVVPHIADWPKSRYGSIPLTPVVHKGLQKLLHAMTDNFGDGWFISKWHLVAVALSDKGARKDLAAAGFDVDALLDFVWSQSDFRGFRDNVNYNLDPVSHSESL